MNDFKKDFSPEAQGFFDRYDNTIYFEKGIIEFSNYSHEVAVGISRLTESQTRELYEAMKKYYDSQENKES